jgi:hypothetical protein
VIKGALITAVVTAGILMAGTAVASGATVDRTVYKCEGTGTWQVHVDLGGADYADRTLSAPAGACKKIHVAVEDDANFTIESLDTGDAAGPGRVDLIGANVSGVNAFVGVTTNSNLPILKGPIVIAGDSLNATLTGIDATPWTVSEVHTGDGSCGLNCYRTKATWIGTYQGL